MPDIKHSFDLLNNSNYSSWADNMQAFLSTKDLWLVTNGSDPEPVPVDPSAPTAAEKKELRDWKSAFSKASGEIFLGVEPNQRVHIKSVNGNPVKMWEKLEKVHEQKKPGTRFALNDDLFSIRKQEDESLSALMARTQEAMQAIKDLRPTAFTMEQLDEELEIMTLIRALPHDYNSFVSSILLLDSLTLEKLLSAFQNEDTQRSTRHVDSTSSVLALQASVNGKCFFCDAKGHVLKDCNKFKAASLKAKDSGAKWGGRGSRGSKGKKENANEVQENVEESANVAHFESAGHVPLHT